MKKHHEPLWPVIANAARLYARGRLTSLLILLVLVFTAFPMVSGTAFGPILFDLLSIGILVTIVFGIGNNRDHPIIGSIFILTGLCAVLLDQFLPDQNLFFLTAIVLFLFFLTAAIQILGYVMVADKVDVGRINGSICIFLLMGLCWAMIFFLLEYTSPGSFKGLTVDGSPPHPNEDLLTTLVYYSFVTITTLGYGDIVPLSEAARMFSVLAAIMGQFYLAILVARLVSLHLISQTSPPANDDGAPR